MSTALVRTVDSPSLTKLQQLELIKADPATMNVVAQKIAEGDSLKDIANDWRIPYGLFHLWVMGSDDRKEMYDRALKVRADAEIHVALKNANREFVLDKDGEFLLDKDGYPIPRDVKWARLQVATSFKAAEKWDPERFGARVAKNEREITSDDGIAELAKRLAGAFEARNNLPGSIDKTPIDIEEVRI